MTLTAKYDGKCSQCGRKITAGEKIEWEKGRGAKHTNCPAKTSATAADPDAIKISCGQGYGGREFHVGQVFRHKKHGLIFVVSTQKKYFGEDGLSFGVGDEEGYIFSATCRPATAEEGALVLAAEARKAELTASKTRLAQICKQIQADGVRPTGVQPDGEKLMNTQNIYGGGDWWVIGSTGIWYCRNRGADGDDWSDNNVRTGGAGAIGWRVPFMADLADEIRTLAKNLDKR